MPHCPKLEHTLETTRPLTHVTLQQALESIPAPSLLLKQCHIDHHIIRGLHVMCIALMLALLGIFWYMLAADQFDALWLSDDLHAACALH